MPLLFAYGTLQLPDIQLATFGRMLRGEKDEAVGCEKIVITIPDPEVIAATGRAEHLNLRFDVKPDARVPGTVLEVTEEELALSDSYETIARYERRQVALASGRTAWAYVYSSG